VKKRDVAKIDLEFVREGSNHEVWTIGSERLVIPRHREINEHTARGTIKRAEEMASDGEE
jgi:mRNA interferase HicA